MLKPHPFKDIVELTNVDAVIDWLTQLAPALKPKTVAALRKWEVNGYDVQSLFDKDWAEMISDTDDLDQIQKIVRPWAQLQEEKEAKKRRIYAAFTDCAINDQ